MQDTEETEVGRTGRAEPGTTRTAIQTGTDRDTAGIAMEATRSAAEEDTLSRAVLVDPEADPAMVMSATETILETDSNVTRRDQATVIDSDDHTRDRGLHCPETEAGDATPAKGGATPARLVPALEVDPALPDVEVVQDPQGRTLRILVQDRGQGLCRQDPDRDRLTPGTRVDHVLEVRGAEATPKVQSERPSGAPPLADEWLDQFESASQNRFKLKATSHDMAREKSHNLRHQHYPSSSLPHHFPHCAISFLASRHKNTWPRSRGQILGSFRIYDHIRDTRKHVPSEYLSSGRSSSGFAQRID